MKTAKSKTLARRPKASPAKVTQVKKNGPFFKKEGGDRFFEPGRSGFFDAEQGHSSDIQTKLTVGQPDDAYEKEADRVADTVVQGKLHRKPIFESEGDPPEEPAVQRKPVMESVTDALPQNEEGEGRESAPVSIESKLKASKGSGSPLPEGTRNDMER